MPIVKLPNGETAKFPDNMTDEQITSVISKKFPPKQPYDLVNPPGSLHGMSGDILAGLGNMGQNIPTMFFGEHTPRVDMAKVIGTGKENIPFKIGESLLPSVAAGPLAKSQIIASGIGGFINVPEDKRDLMSRSINSAKDAALAFGFMKGLPWLAKNIPTPNIGPMLPSQMKEIPGKLKELPGKLKEYLSPGKSANEFLQKLVGSEKLPTDIENIENFGKRLQLAKKSAEEQALIPKREVMGPYGETNMFKPSTTEYTPNPNAEPYQNLMTYLEELQGNLNKTVKSEYLKLPNVSKNYSGLGLKKLHDDFVENPTFANSDRLISAMKDQIRDLEETVKNRANPNRASARIQLERLKRNKNALEKDQRNFTKTLPEALQKKYSQFNKLWQENVPKFHEAGATTRKLAFNEPGGVTRHDLAQAFEGVPSEQVEKLAQDIGPEGINQLIYNKIMSSHHGKFTGNSAQDLANAILAARAGGGYGHFITPEHEAFANELLKRVKHQKIAMKAAGALGLGALGGLGMKYFTPHTQQNTGL